MPKEYTLKFSAAVTLQYPYPFTPYGPEAWKEGLDWIAASGLDGAEVCICDYHGVDVPAFKEELDKRGLGCSTISTGQARAREGLSFSGVPADVIARTQERYRQHVDAAAILHSKVTLGLICGVGSPESREADLATLRESLLPLADYAEKKGVMLILEPLNRYETNILNATEAAADFIRNRLGNPPSVSVLYDLFHSNIEDATFDGAIDRLGSLLQHVHIADSNRQFPGYGHTDFDAIFGKLKAVGFSEYASFEHFNLPSRETVLQKTGRWVASMR